MQGLFRQGDGGATDFKILATLLCETPQERSSEIRLLIWRPSDINTAAGPQAFVEFVVSKTSGAG
ncbi:MAG: hypothetical protein IPL83_09445 [Bdellovibrionales bacterium]|nr:hypothetical protein [Bdellovibrionales bacterium]